MTILLDDNFNRADTVINASAGNTSCGNNWEDINGSTAQISTNRLRVAPFSGSGWQSRYLLQPSSGFPDGIRGTLLGNGGLNIQGGLAMHWSAAGSGRGNYYLGGYSPSLGGLGIHLVRGTSTLVLASSAFSPNFANDHDIVFQRKNGVLVLSWRNLTTQASSAIFTRDTTYTSGRVGFVGWGDLNREEFWDDAQVATGGEFAYSIAYVDSTVRLETTPYAAAASPVIDNGGSLIISHDCINTGASSNTNRPYLGSLFIRNGSVLVDGDVLEITVDNTTNAALGQTMTGGTSGATGIVCQILSSPNRIRYRNYSVVQFQNGETVTHLGGFSATISGSPVVAPLSILHINASFIGGSTQGTWRFRGLWRELGTSNGNASQTFTAPQPVGMGGVWVQRGHTFTFTNGSATLTSTHEFSVNDIVVFATTGSLATNFSPNTPYYVVFSDYDSSWPGTTGTVFTVSASRGGAAIVAGSAGSGTHTALMRGAVFTSTGSGDTLTVPNGHNQSVGDIISFRSSNSPYTLPDPLNPYRSYYVVATPSNTQLKVSLIAGGTPITLTSTGSGTHTILPDKAFVHYVNLVDRAITTAGNNLNVGRVVAQPQSSTTITFGNNTNGRIPPTEAIVRIPNIFLGYTTAATAPTAQSAYGQWNLSSPLSIGIDFERAIATTLQSNGVTYPRDISLRCTSLNTNFWRFNQIVQTLSIQDCIASKTTASVNNPLIEVNLSSSVINGLTILNSGTNVSNECLAINQGISFLGANIKAIRIHNATARSLLFRETNGSITGLNSVGGLISWDTVTSFTITGYGWNDSIAGTAGNRAFYEIVSSSNIAIKKFRNQTELQGSALSTSSTKFNNIYLEDWGTATNFLPGNGSANWLSANTQIPFTGMKIKNMFVVSHAPIRNVTGGDGAQVIKTLSTTQVITLSGINNLLLKAVGWNPSLNGRFTGFHWWDAFQSSTEPTFGYIFLQFWNPTSNYFSRIQVTNNSTASGNPFDGLGNLLLPTSNDTVTFEMPYFAQGHTELGTVSITGTNIDNHTFEVQWNKNDGNGWNGVWTSFSNDANIGAIVGALSAPQYFIKLRLRITCSVANTTNSLSGVEFSTLATGTSFAAVNHPVINPVNVTISGLQPTANLLVRDANNLSTTLFSATSDSSGLYSTIYEYDLSNPIDYAAQIRARKPGFSRIQITSLLNSNGLNAIAAYVTDSFSDSSGASITGISIALSGNTVTGITITQSRSFTQIHNYIANYLASNLAVNDFESFDGSSLGIDANVTLSGDGLFTGSQALNLGSGRTLTLPSAGVFSFAASLPSDSFLVVAGGNTSILGFQSSGATISAPSPAILTVGNVSQWTAGANVTLQSPQPPITITTNPLGARVGVFRVSDNFQILNTNSNAITGIASTSYSGSTPVDVVVRVRLSGYKPYSAIQTITNNGLTLSVTLERDIADNIPD